MICPKCGAENAEDAAVCAACGGEMTAPGIRPSESAVQKGKKKKRRISGLALLMIVGAAILLALLAIVGIAALSGGPRGDYIYCEQDVVLFADNEGGEANQTERTTVFVNGKAIGETVVGSAQTVASGLDNRITLIRGTKDGEIAYYTLRGKKLTAIEGSGEWQNPMLSASGEGLAYTVQEGDGQSLYLYQVRKNESVKVETSPALVCRAISPDGSTVAYSVSDDTSDISYYFNGKDRVKLGKSVSVIALSNGGKYIYAKDNDGDLVLYNKKGEKITRIGRGKVLYLNSEHTQMIFVGEEDGKAYISVKGGEGEPFFRDGDLTPVSPAESKSVTDLTAEGRDFPLTCALGSFYDQYYACGSGIYLVRKDYEKNVKLSTDRHNAIGYPEITQDGKRIYYVCDGDLRMVKTAWGKDAPEKEITVAEGIDDYVIPTDYGRIYCRKKSELFSVDSDGNSRETIADGVSSALYRAAGDVVYFMRQGNLYACSNGKSAKQVLPDAQFCKGGILGHCFFQSDGAVYCTTGSKKPKKVFTIGD